MEECEFIPPFESSWFSVSHSLTNCKEIEIIANKYLSFMDFNHLTLEIKNNFHIIANF